MAKVNKKERAYELTGWIPVATPPVHPGVYEITHDPKGVAKGHHRPHYRRWTGTDFCVGHFDREGADKEKEVNKGIRKNGYYWRGVTTPPLDVQSRNPASSDVVPGFKYVVAA